ncbi:MAG TPA: chromate transporter [Candidatus Fusicatenibacter intestinigallinarum]|uniref:Chromate transporter n=1 Tax=Candidatus Fusicatenibacter intestinigallinarum TaxID=2838598 RepID=A0A9D2N826_9FIRM|nr:chromate transporter [Candidatus Fusicatenibacter intestinigallinarum]
MSGAEEVKLEKKSTVLKKLFLSTLSLSAFTFGGGYVIISLMKTKFVDELHWITEDEMLDMTAIAQSSPGAIAVNGAIVVGYKLAGIPGVLISVLGAILPPMVILSVVSLCYDAFISNPVIAALLKGMESGIGAVIASVVWDMAAGIVKQKSVFSIAVMAGSFLACMVWKVNVVFIILAAAALGVFRTLWAEKRGKRK